MTELMRRIFGGLTDSFLRRYWVPRTGDRVEFIITPEWHYYENIIKPQDRATVVNVIQGGGWTHKLDVVFAMDDGREIRINFFDPSVVRVVGLAGLRKSAT